MPTMNNNNPSNSAEEQTADYKLAPEQDVVQAEDDTIVLSSGLSAALPQISLGNGHRCFGYGLDMRRSVILVDMINIGYVIAGIISLVVLHSLDSSEFDDDDVQVVASEMDDNMGLLMAFAVLKVGLSVLGIYGAMQYNIYMVAVCLATYLFDFFYSLSLMNMMPVIYSSLFAYPHVVYIYEVQLGIVTPDNYLSSGYEKCCCA